MTQKQGAAYDEALRVPLRWWALATMLLATFLLAFLVALPVVVAVGAAGVLTALVVALLVGYGAAHVAVHDGVLHAGRASIAVSFLRNPVVLNAEEARRIAGMDADARAYLLLRPYLRRAVKVEVADPTDPTPYWLVSSRRPDRVVAAITAAMAERPSA